MNKKTGGPAFPQAYQHTEVVAKMYETGELTAEQLKQESSQLAGMTLRDYFAAKAMQATVIAWIQQSIYPSTDFEVAQNAYAVADAMLQAREQ